MTNVSLRTNDYINEVLCNYSDMVYKLALSQTKNRADADDVFQEVFISFMKNTKPFESEEHKKAWLIRVTINHSRKIFRSAWFRRTVSLKEPLSETLQFDMKEKSDVYDAVLQLPRKYRTAIHLFYYENMSIVQISKVLSIPESTVKSHLYRARQMLKHKLEGDSEHENKFI